MKIDGLKLNKLDIRNPKYSTNEVLLATHKIGEHNLVYFTEAKALLGKDFYVHIDDVKDCKIQPNGKGKVYCVPMDRLKLIVNGEVLEDEAEEPELTREDELLGLIYVFMEDFEEINQRYKKGKK